VEPTEYDRNRIEEDHHWWFRWRNGVVLDWLDRLVTHPPRRVLDAGCGTGGMLARLAELGLDAVGLDSAPQAIDHCRDRGVRRLTRGSVAELPFADDAFDVVLCLDVLYHRGVDDDVAVIRELARCLAPGGLLLATVPAFAWLASAHDVAVHTRERYTRRRLRGRLESAGLRVERISCLFLLVAPLVWPVKLMSRPGVQRTGVSPHWRVSGWADRLLGPLMIGERWLARRLDLPLGSTLIAAAVRE
jgi:SAM-dependent methyltransferase